MSTTQTFEDITKEVCASFMIANIFEANFRMDTFLQSANYPVHILLPYDVRDVIGENGVRRTVLPLEGFFLTKIDNPTIDYVTGEADKVAIEPMRALARKYFDKLSVNSIINNEVENIAVQYLPTYAIYDVHIFGVNYRCDLPVIESIECE